MRNWLASLLILTFISAVTGKNDFPNEVIVTSADVVDGEIKNIGKAGESYRLYAIYGQGSDDAQVKQVSITDSAGKVFKFADLHKVGANFLSENNIVVGPLKVTDPTLPIQTRKRSVAFRLTYTIYLVSTKVPALPVADFIEGARTFSLNSNDYNGKETKGLTVLSADKFFTLRQFKFSADAAYIIPRGYDLISATADDSVIDLKKENAYSSYVTIFGPVATILNKDQTKTGTFQIGFDIVSSLSPPEGLDVGASLTFLSPNWLDIAKSYSTSFQSYSEAFDRTFTFKDDALLNFQLSTSSFKQGESVSLTIANKKGEVKQYGHGMAADGEIGDAVIGNSIHLKAVVANLPSPSTYPRFILKVTTSATDLTATTAKPPSTTSSVRAVSLFSALFVVLAIA